MSFLQLPVELVCDVLQLLSVQDLLQCNLVSSEGDFLSHSCLISCSQLSFASRLRLLRDREYAWRTLNPKSRHQLKLAHSGTIYEFAGGVYGVGKEIERRTAFITFYDLPSVASGVQRSIKHTFSETNVVDFTMDPAQDLLVLVSMNHDSPYVYDLHLRKLSTNEPHPLAPAPILPCYQKQQGLNLADGAVQIQISGDVIGFLVKETLLSLRAHFEGVSIICMVKSLVGIDDFTFLSEDHFLLVQPNGLFDVYSFSGSISDLSNPILRASYELPALSPAYSFWYISLSSNPSPDFPGPAGENKAFYCSPADRLHACCIYVYQPALPDRDTVYPFVFFFHPKTLLKSQHEWKHPSLNADSNIFPLWQGLNMLEAHDDNVPSPPTSNYNSPVFSDTSMPSSPHSNPPSSASSVSLDGSSNDLLNFPAPQAAHAGSSMLFDASPSTFNRATPSKAQSHIRVPWEAWGPQNTRWFREHLSKDWQRSIYGLRTVDCVVDRAALESSIYRSGSVGEDSEIGQNDSDSFFEDDGGDESDEDGFIFINEVAFSVGDIESQLGCTGTLPKFIRVRDFNPYSISKAVEELAINESLQIQDRPSPQFRLPSRVVTGPSKVNARGVFSENISSCLPYVEVISKDTFNVNEVMMDDSRLLLIKRGRGRKLKTITILDM
ncbi:hypothetical protein DFJ43DRAFT_988801 [Lentinula guzmanii]|uniref:F-box domain-containing protein n=1 Tax=Lentinula guzmanii TaxID=2804957 RepID=A0AA38JGY6_9AGAR|nr:hypothetical protein DFJ43DRAFT_988801 [Lentinula guzmanii]